MVDDLQDTTLNTFIFASLTRFIWRLLGSLVVKILRPICSVKLSATTIVRFRMMCSPT